MDGLVKRFFSNGIDEDNLFAAYQGINNSNTAYNQHMPKRMSNTNLNQNESMMITNNNNNNNKLNYTTPNMNMNQNNLTNPYPNPNVIPTLHRTPQV